MSAGAARRRVELRMAPSRPAMVTEMKAVSVNMPSRCRSSRFSAAPLDQREGPQRGDQQQGQAGPQQHQAPLARVQGSGLLVDGHKSGGISVVFAYFTRRL